MASAAIREPRIGRLAPLNGCGGDDAHAVSIEDEGFHFRLGAVGGNFLAIPQEGDSSGIADPGYDFPVSVDRGMRRGNESFLADGLAVGLNGYPRCLMCPDHEF